MNEINMIGTLATSPTLRDFANQPYLRSDSGNTAVLEDSVEISELADFLGRLAELPEARARKIVEIRSAILNETYESPEKLEIAVERILGAL